MNRTRRHLALSWLLVTMSALCTTSAFAEDGSEAKSESEQIRERFEMLRTDRQSSHLEIAALEEAIPTASGEDLDALRGQILEFRLDGTDTINDMWALVEELEAAELDATSERRFLASIYPPLLTSVPAQYEVQLAEYAQLKAEQSDLTDAGARAAITPVIARKGEVLLRILDTSIDLLTVGDALEIATKAQRTWLETKVLERARLARSHVDLATKLRSDVEARKSAGADPAAIQLEEVAANARFDASLAMLEKIVGLMKRLELDDSNYRQLIVSSSGEVTVDAIDRQVVGELVGSWSSDLRDNAAENGPRYLFEALLVILILSFFWGLSRFVRRIVARAVEAPHLRFSELLKRMIVSLSSGVVLLLGLLVALSQLGIEIAPMLAGLGIAGFVLGFALQDTLGNFAAGVMILMYRPFDVGDMIDCAGGVFGQVSHMSLVSTTILTIDNKTLIVPNNKIWGDVITNVTAQAIRRVDLEFGIGYSDDIPHAEEVLWSIIKDHPKVLEDPEPVVRVHSLGDSSVNFIVRPWVARDDYWDVHWDFMREVKLRFDREGVSIPFPQRDVHFYTTDSSDADARESSGKMEVGSTALESTDEPEASEDD